MDQVPSGCDVTLATLRLYADGVTAGRTLVVQRADPAAPLWTEASLSWADQPVAVGAESSAVLTSGSGYKSWTVTDPVRELYAASNNGFVVRDQTEGGAGAWQQFHARHLTYPATLRVVWG